MNIPDSTTIERLYATPIDWTQSHITTLAEITQLLHPRPTNAHKGTFGHALLIAGKRDMAGAAILAGRACLRSGAGLVSIHTPSYNVPIIQCSLPEAIISEDNATHCFTQVPSTGIFDAIAIGPGIGTSDATVQAVAQLLSNESNRPLIIDADALNIIGANRELLGQIPSGSIITPHFRELQRLAGHEFHLSERLHEAHKLATTLDIYIIVKGAYTAIVQPNGQTIFNPTGNAGMATAGSGDVLTGILTALIAQGYTALDACKTAVFIHGMAGDMAALKIGQTSLIASNIIEHLPLAWKTITEQNSH